MKDGRFADEIVPVEIPQRKGDPILVETDEGVRPGTTVESLGKLRPAFAKDGTITAGNASQISDGAAAVIVISSREGGRARAHAARRARRLRPGGRPRPVAAAPSRRARSSRRSTQAEPAARVDVDLFELNEAFAAVGLASMHDLGITDDIVNVNGGAIALGHPIGMSGTRSCSRSSTSCAAAAAASARPPSAAAAARATPRSSAPCRALIPGRDPFPAPRRPQGRGRSGRILRRGCPRQAGIADEVGTMMDARWLRPLGVGEVIDGALEIYRARFGTMLKAVAIVVVPVQVFNVLVVLSLPSPTTTRTTSGFTTTTTSTGNSGTVIAAILLLQVVVIVSGLLATAACLKVVSDAYLGTVSSWRESLRFGLSKLRSIVWVGLLNALGVGLGFLFCIVPGVWLYVSWAIAVPVLLIEGTKGTKAMTRSRELVKGRWWPTCGALLIAFLITAAVSFALTIFTIPLLFSGASYTTTQTATALARGVALVLTTPFSAAVVALIYFELRVRKEGFDVALDGPAHGGEPAVRRLRAGAGRVGGPVRAVGHPTPRRDVAPGPGPRSVEPAARGLVGAAADRAAPPAVTPTPSWGDPLAPAPAVPPASAPWSTPPVDATRGPAGPRADVEPARAATGTAEPRAATRAARVRAGGAAVDFLVGRDPPRSRATGGARGRGRPAA